MRAGIEPDKAGFTAPFREHAERLLAHAGRTFDRHPVVVRGLHEDRLRVARLGIGHGPTVGVLPDRLVAVDVALAFDVCAAAEHAVLEFALALERLHAGLHLGLREITAAARAAELQHDGLARNVGVLGLRAVIHRLREVADHAGDELAVAAVVEHALELVADLLEIMPVAGRVEIAAHLAERKLEIVERAGLAFDHDTAVEDAAAMLQAALERDLVGLDDLHGFLLRPRPFRARQDNVFGTEYLGGSLLAAPRGRSMLPKFSALAVVALTVVALTFAAPAIAPPAHAQPDPATTYPNR